jgi:3-deoxy-D-manno-octulosonate 8-phosphate phosphatase (KDO 8-P phosphatase)
MPLTRLRDRLLKIKAIVFDIDGVLTDSKIIYDNNGNEIKNFNVKDGFIIAPLKKAGFVVGAITGRQSPVAAFRCNELQLNFHLHGVTHKATALETVKKDFGLTDEEIFYIGDDLPDLELIINSGVGACPADSPVYIQHRAALVTKAKGGEGVLREVAELVLEAQGKLETIIEEYSGK